MILKLRKLTKSSKPSLAILINRTKARGAKAEYPGKGENPGIKQSIAVTRK